LYAGYFNPILKGHIDYFDNTKALVDALFVIVNNDHQRSLKGSKEFQQEVERVFIVSNIKSVDHCVLSIDQDRTVCKTIEKSALDFDSEYELSFANGGDQNNKTILERPIYDQIGITLVDGLGDKIQSSSRLLNK
tara:strand:- start:55 stop:459 length:405 start_codon:yes stop_codon:yes gene_type:complete